jgi:hypothetical protein
MAGNQRNLNVLAAVMSNPYMKTSSMLKVSLVAVTGSLLVTGCVVRDRGYYAPPPPVAYAPPPAQVVAPGEVVVATDPPPLIQEPYPAVTRPGFVWVRGSWVWRGNHWVWSRGRWEHPPRADAAWVDGRYEVRGGVRVYVGGGWR